MKQRAEKKDQVDQPAQRPGSATWSQKIALFCIALFLVAVFIYAYIQSGFPSSREIIISFSVGVPGFLLIRSGMMIGVLLGNSLQYFQQNPRSVAQKNALIRLAKREVVWYAGAVFSLLLAYRWTPFAGHTDIFFILTVAIPLSLSVIFAFYIFLIHRGFR